jgi:hypothetical protein
MFDEMNQGPPAGPFIHPEGCKIFRADPAVEIPWNEVDPGVWERRCVCNVEHIRVDPGGGLVRFDPYDGHLPPPGGLRATGRNRARAILKGQECEGYWWVQCGACDGGWQVPLYAATSMG